MGSEQDVTLETPMHMFDDPKKMLEDVTGMGHHVRGNLRVKITDALEIPYSTVIIEQILKEMNA